MEPHGKVWWFPGNQGSPGPPHWDLGRQPGCLISVIMSAGERCFSSGNLSLSHSHKYSWHYLSKAPWRVNPTICATDVFFQLCRQLWKKLRWSHCSVRAILITGLCGYDTENPSWGNLCSQTWQFNYIQLIQRWLFSTAWWLFIVTVMPQILWLWDFFFSAKLKVLHRCFLINLRSLPHLR